MKPSTYSNVLFLIPFFLALYFGLYLYAFVIFFVITVSLSYHHSNREKFIKADENTSWLLITSNLYLCFLGNFHTPHFLYALLLVAISSYFYFNQKKNYELYHSLWHVGSVGITVLSIIISQNGLLF